MSTVDGSRSKLDRSTNAARVGAHARGEQQQEQQRDAESSKTGCRIPNLKNTPSLLYIWKSKIILPNLKITPSLLYAWN